MESLSKVTELVEEVRNLLRVEYPEFSNAIVAFGTDGYMNISVTEWDRQEKEKVENRKHRQLLFISNVDGKWTKDCSENQNEYLKKNGHLLGRC